MLLVLQGTVADDKVRSILGPALGGALAQPCENYPALFARDTLFDRHPFLLPNLVCAIILAGGVLIGILFLEETHEEMKHNRDVGLEIGRWILTRLGGSQIQQPVFDKAGDANLDESQSLLEDELPPGYRTTDGSPRLPSSRAQSPESKSNAARENKPRGMPRAFSKQVVLNIVGYGILA